MCPSNSAVRIDVQHHRAICAKGKNDVVVRKSDQTLAITPSIILHRIVRVCPKQSALRIKAQHANFGTSQIDLTGYYKVPG